MKMDRDRDAWIGPLAVCVLICQAAGLIGGLFTRAGLEPWYSSLVKPSFTPPSWVFGPVWIVLYLMMGVSLFLLWQVPDKGRARRDALAAFAVQLVLNILWSFVFFGLHLPWAAFFEIVALVLSVLVTILLAWKVSRWAAWLLAPYLIWSCFAMALNLSVAVLNP